MKHPYLNTKVKHSKSKNAWNVIGDVPGRKYKIARIPYEQVDGEDYDVYNTVEKSEALDYAMFISYCFNNPDMINLKNQK